MAARSGCSSSSHSDDIINNLMTFDDRMSLRATVAKQRAKRNDYAENVKIMMVLNSFTYVTFHDVLRCTCCTAAYLLETKFEIPFNVYTWVVRTIAGLQPKVSEAMKLHPTRFLTTCVIVSPH